MKTASFRLAWFCVAAIIVLMAVVCYIYARGLNGPFVFDDGINIVNNQSLRLDDLSWASLYRAATSIPNGMFGRPLSMLSFAADFYWDRAIVSPFPIPNTFKTTNLLIHVVNGLVLFALTHLLVRSTSDLRNTPYPRSYSLWIALVVSAAWMLHPFNLTGVLYVVQRMTSLSTLFILLGMVFYLVGRRRLENCQNGAFVIMLAAVGIFTPLAFLCKEIGLLLPAYIMLIERICFIESRLDGKTKRYLETFFAVFFWLPFAAGMVFFLSHTEWFLNGYVRRDFSLSERLMTESRVVWFYFYQTVLPNIAMMGIFHDDFEVSRSFFNPLDTAIASIGLLVLLVMVMAWRKAQPLVAFGLAFFLLGHSLESTIIPLEIIHEHRNYLPGFGILLVLFHLLMDPTTAPDTRVWRRIAVVALLVLFAVITHSRVIDWSSSQKLWDAETTHHPASVRSQLAMGHYYGDTLTLNPIDREINYSKATEAFERALQLDKSNTIALFGLLKLGKTFEREVDVRYFEELMYGLRQGSIAPDTNDRLMNLALCLGQAFCPVTTEQFEDLLGATLDNPKLQGRDKALIYSAKTFYLVNVAHDYKRALVSTRQAIELDGDIEHQMWLANILVAMHDTHAAQQQIDLLRKLDSRHIRQKEIDALELQNTAESR